MSALLATLLSLIPRALLFVVAPLITEKFVAKLIGIMLVYSLEKAASLTTNTLDDNLVQDMKTTLIQAGVINAD